MLDVQIMPLKLKVLWGVTASLTAAAVGAEVEGLPHLLSSGLSLVAIASAITSVITTKVKTDRNVEDVKSVGKKVDDNREELEGKIETAHRETVRLFERIEDKFKEALAENRTAATEMRDDMRNDFRVHQIGVNESIREIKTTIEMQTQQRRRRDPQS